MHSKMSPVMSSLCNVFTDKRPELAGKQELTFFYSTSLNKEAKFTHVAVRETPTCNRKPRNRSEPPPVMSLMITTDHVEVC